MSCVQIDTQRKTYTQRDRQTERERERDVVGGKTRKPISILTHSNNRCQQLTLFALVCGRRPRVCELKRQTNAARWHHGKADVWNRMNSVQPSVTRTWWQWQRRATRVTFRRLAKVSSVHIHFMNTTLAIILHYHCRFIFFSAVYRSILICILL